MSIKFIITFQAKPEFEAKFANLMQQVKTNLPEADGCEGVQIFADAENPCVFTLLERWNSKSAHNANSQQLVKSGAWNEILAMLVGEPNGSYVTQL